MTETQKISRIEEAMAHLGSAISQSAPSDDKIIMDHVRDAHALIREVARDLRGV